MPQPLTTLEIKQFSTAIENGGTPHEQLQQAIGVYDTLLANGYNYAGWAGGVARGDTVTGVAALDYLQGTALMGIGGDACRNLTTQQIEKIKVDMALGYLDTLKKISETSGGTIDRDVKFNETQDFHEKAMVDNHLDINNWTLKTPIDLIQQRYGDQEVEKTWELLRDTGGTGLDAIGRSLDLTYTTGKFSYSSDPNLSGPAQVWIDSTIGALNWEKIQKFGDVAFGAEVRQSMFLTMPVMSVLVNSLFGSALNWVAPKDPLILDLDGDGIEAIGINSNAPILFDMDGDGTKTATGWIKTDDGIVVLDRNGNGQIDSGRELFGDSTVLQNGPKAGQIAANGYEALADLDLNGDGIINSADAAYSQLRIWQDTNQNGISESTELHTLDELDIASINLTSTASNLNLGNGNTQPLSGSFTYSNGSAGSSGVAEVTGSLLLANNNFYREFTDDPALTTEALALPQMQGSGAVRDLRPAMSLGDAQADILQTKLAEFATDATHAQQLKQVDAVIQSWGVIQTGAPLAHSTRARSHFVHESKALSLPSDQRPCSPSPCHYRLHCARSGFPRRALRHQYSCDQKLVAWKR